MSDNKTIDNLGMKGNQQAYDFGDEKIGFSSDGESKVYAKDEKVSSDINDLLIRTDVDEYNPKYRAAELQNHNTGSGLDITTYSVYSGFKEPNKEPSRLIVGVAGTKDSTDVVQNGVPLNRSHYGKQEEYLLKHWDRTNRNMEHSRYELEIRQKVVALQKYRENGVPIAIVGDSKGGEDAAYLALKFVKATSPGNKDKIDYSAVNLYVTNPKGIRVDDEDYAVLEKMAKAGKVTVEVVYPEILSKYGIHKIPREIPYTSKIYTVPNALRSSIENHKIGGYEDKVYQGFNGKFKFQCDQEPTKIIESDYTDDTSGFVGVPGAKASQSKHRGYRYVVTRITDRSGKSISVNNYFFEAKIEALKQLIERINQEIAGYEKLQAEPLLHYFKTCVRDKKSKLMEQHEILIKAFTPFAAYQREKNQQMIEMDISVGELKNEYNRVLDNHLSLESDSYSDVVSSRVQASVEQYQRGLYNEAQLLRNKVHRLQTEVMPNIRQAQEAFEQSQERLQLIIEKRNI